MKPNISQNISYREATHSDTAIRFGVENTPSEEQLLNMKRLAEKVFEPLRTFCGSKSIHISSFFRSILLNKLIGGASATSQHCANEDAAAMDLDNDNKAEGPSNKVLFETIREMLSFDQLILEFPDKDENPAWVHVSFKKQGNRNQVLKSEWVDGKVIYTKIT